MNLFLSILASAIAMFFGLAAFFVWYMRDAEKRWHDHFNDPDVKAERERQKRWREHWRKP